MLGIGRIAESTRRGFGRERACAARWGVLY